MSRMVAAQLLGLDWGAIGVIGGAIYATYQAFTTGQIKSVVLELKLAMQEKISTIEQKVAVNFEKHSTLAGSVKELRDEILQLHKDIAYRDGQLAGRGGDPKT